MSLETLSDSLGDEMPVPGVGSAVNIVGKGQKFEALHQAHHIRRVGVVVWMALVISMRPQKGTRVNLLPNAIVTVSL